ncbi:protein CBFA2T3 isoform X14 [Macaca mulatta]
MICCTVFSRLRHGGSWVQWKSPSLGVQDLGSSPTRPTSLCGPGEALLRASVPSLPRHPPMALLGRNLRPTEVKHLIFEARGQVELLATQPRPPLLGPARPPGPPSPHHRQTCPCCSGSSCTVHAWPSRRPPSTWPSMSSSCWTPAPPPPSTPQSCCWKSMRTARGGRLTENGLDRDPLHPEHLSKRPCTLNPAQRYSPSNGPPQPTPPHYRLEDIAMAHHFRDAYRHADPRELRERHRLLVVPGSRQEEVIDHKLTEREWAEEWKHLNNLLNCIMDMVEKTRRSLTVLRRCQEADREELNHWARRCSDTEDTKKGPSPATARPRSSSAGPEGSQPDVPREFLPRTLTGYMPEDIWRKAEEAVNEVKRQAMSELQKAVSDAERKAHELISTERAKMERALAEAKRQASEDALTVVNQQEDSSESCWNCGRKASETCSGCNAARYCGSFCQHRDWEKHHHVCGQSLQGPVAVVADPVPGPPEAAHGLGPSLPVGAASPSEAGSAGPSRPGSPSPPGPLDAVPR